MARKSDKREKLIQAARELIHEQGYARTSIADIASRAGVPLGNVYYYYKTKADILDAVVAARIEFIDSIQQALDETVAEPMARVVQMFSMLSQDLDGVIANGCPIGSLALELNKSEPKLAKRNAQVLINQHSWLLRQYTEAGEANPRARADNIMSRWQGAALMANTLSDHNLLHREITSLAQEAQSVHQSQAPMTTGGQ